MFYISNSPFPSNLAYATRTYYLCKLYEQLGYKVTIISAEGISEDVRWLDIGSIKTKSFFPAINGWKMNLKSLFMGGSNLKKVLDKLSEENPDIVIMGGGYTRLFIPVSEFCKRKQAKLIIEFCEWFNMTQFPLGILGPFYWDNRIVMKLLYKKADGIIAISSYLEDYYNRLGKKTIRIPTILDADYKIKINKGIFNTCKLNIVYAGSLGKRKDMLQVIIGALLKDPNLQKYIHLHIIGPSEQSINSLIKKTNKSYNNMSHCVTTYGKVSREIALQYVSEADFTILIREDTLNARAGFPTKVAESMLQGTPVITNITSDIGLYLKNMETGIVANGNTIDDVIDALKKAIELNRSEIESMRNKCKIVARENFDYRVYIDKIKKFNSLINKSEDKLNEQNNNI